MAFTKVTAAGINTGGSFVLENINTSGIITASTVNVGSAVTISSSGANLTGIVTAGTVQVGSATTIHTTGIDLGGGTLTSHNINSTGIITATSGFDGNLTGNVTGDLTGNVTGNVSSSGANTLGSLTVTNDATVGGALTVTGDFTVNGTTTTIDTIVTAVDSLAVDGNVTAGGNLNVSGVSTFQGNVDLGDNDRLRFGDGNGLQIYHTGSNSYIDDDGSGNLNIRSNGSFINLGTISGETMISAKTNGNVELFYDNSKKFETTGTGVTITGDARVTGILTVGTASVTIDGSQDFPTIRPTLDLNFAATKTLDRRITFTRDSIGTYIDELGVLKYASNNVPRFDHDPDTGESLGLLIEESRTNAFLYSDLSTVDTTSNATTSRTTGLDGNSTSALDVTYTSASGAYILSYSSPISASTEYTFSVWIKKVSGSAGGTAVYSYVQNGTNGVLSGTIYNTDGQHIGQAPTGVWKRYSKTFTTSSGSTAIRITMPGYDSNGLNVQYFGAQVEAGSFATSYIPTEASQVTRQPDKAQITGTNFTEWYNASEGTVFLEDICQNPSNDWTSALAFMGNDTYNRLLFFKNWAGVYNIFEVYSNGVQSVRLQYDANVGQTYKICNAYKLDDFASSVSGQIQTDTSAAVPTVNRLEFGSTTSQSSFNVSYVGHLKQLTYYPKRLTNAQLQSLTRQ